MRAASQRSREAAGLLALSAGTLLCSGFHPWSEDGGLYAAGVEWLLDPTLFPHDRAFVTAHLGYSIFAPLVAAMVRGTGLSVAAVLLWTDFLGILLGLYAGLRLSRRLFASHAAQWAAVACLAACWTIPVAGTSLLLNDPYVTARTLSTPLSLLALSFAVDERLKTLRWLLTCVTLLLAAAFHPLMAGYAALLVICVALEQAPAAWRHLGWVALAAGTALLCASLQWRAAPESPAQVAAAVSRYYWFLSRWQWFEWLGLAGPLTIFAALLRYPSPGSRAPLRPLLRAAIGSGLIAVVTALLFAQEHFAAHAVARLQPLRAFLLLYALLALTLGAFAGALTERLVATRHRALPVLVCGFALIAMIFYAVSRLSYAPSAQIEWPGATPRNPWAQAFLWARENTARDAIFALDARYVNEDREGALVFRALARRDQLPDYSKDGGEAAITPALADRWRIGATASQGLSSIGDGERETRLQGTGVTWIILHANAPTALSCPYRNAVVKVCRLGQPTGTSGPIIGRRLSP